MMLNISSQIFHKIQHFDQRMRFSWIIFPVNNLRYTVPSQNQTSQNYSGTTITLVMIQSMTLSLQIMSLEISLDGTKLRTKTCGCRAAMPRLSIRTNMHSRFTRNQPMILICVSYECTELQVTKSPKISSLMAAKVLSTTLPKRSQSFLKHIFPWK